MRKGGGKQKGAAFERAVCVELSLWLSGNSRRDLLWRSAMSGGRATLQLRKGQKNQTQGGDISAIDPLGHKLTDRFLIECKAYKNLALHSLILPECGSGLGPFWEKCYEQAQQVSKLPMLIFRQNQFGSFVCLDRGGMAVFDLLGEQNAAAYFPHRNLYLVLLKTFLMEAHLPVRRPRISQYDERSPRF